MSTPTTCRDYAASVKGIDMDEDDDGPITLVDQLDSEIGDEEPDSAPDYEHDEECPCERCVDERAYIGELADLGLIP